MIKAGIIGAGGYAGVTLVSILLRHPQVELIWISSEPAHEGKKLSELYPFMRGICELKCKKAMEEKDVKAADIVFLGVPHGLAMDFVPDLRKAGKKVIDLSADYRFKDKEVYEKWYIKHKGAEYLKETVYGLPELYKDKIKKAELIGNPGCYPTAAILGAAPLVKEGLIDTSNIFVDAKTGVSGAGRGLNLVTHFPECNEGVAAYKVMTHRHSAEMDVELGSLAGKNIEVAFAPHLVPMNRGILASIYGILKKKIDQQKLIDIYKKFYKNEPFVRVIEGQGLPSTKEVYASNYCDIALRVSENKVVVLSAIDNLVKGAAGQAVQNMNLVYGLDEKLGLESVPVYP